MMSTLRFLRKFQRTPDFTFCKSKYLQRFFCGGNNGNLWEDDFTRPVPEFDWDYLCKDENLKEIEENVNNRKGVGDIHKVRSLWKQISTENDASKKEILQSELLKAAAELPNRTSPTSPIGHEEMARVEETLGEKKEFTFKPQSVLEIGSRLGLLRTQDVGHTTGPRTYYFISDFAKLEQALIKYTLKKILPQGFTLVSVPDIINANIIEACGFKTSGERNQVYKLDPRYHNDLCLAGTSEMSLAGFFMNEVFEEKDLPKKVCAVSRCYRAETSAVEEGIYRVHQFTKVEMFGVTPKDGGENLLKELLEIEKELFCGLGLHFRILNMPTHELGAPAYKKYDIESWMPAKGFWGEISSASNCTDYQSRRLNIKYRNSEGKLAYAETVNGTACAIPRLIMALTENFQEENGNVAIPAVLQHYMSGQTHLRKHQKRGKMKFIAGKQGG